MIFIIIFVGYKTLKMGQIGNTILYPFDVSVSLLDYLIGTDATDNKKAKSYQLKRLVEILNVVNGGSAVAYHFSDGSNVDLTVLEPGYFFSETNIITPNTLTKLHFNNLTIENKDISVFFDKMITSGLFKFKLSNLSNPNNFVYLSPSNVVLSANYLSFEVADFNDLYSGNLLNNADYVLSFDLASNLVAVTDPLKLDKSTYVGNAKNLDDRIIVLENLQNLDTNFTGQAFAVWTGVGFIYDVIYPSYYIQGVLYPGATEQITLNASDVTHPRQDVIAVDATGAIKITGVAEANPLVPTIDNDTQIYITTVLVNANATTPAVTQQDVYKENAEWTTASNIGSLVFNATASPFQGTTHIDCGSFSGGQYIRFTDNTTNQITDYNNLKFYLNLKGAFSTNTRLAIRFFNGATIVSTTLQLTSGTYNFNRTITNSYQTISIPLTAFTFTSSTFDRIEIATVGTSLSGFRMDNIVLYKDDSVASPAQKAITSIVTNSGIINATTADDTISIIGGNGAVVSAVGKVITITPAAGTNYVSQTITDGVTVTSPSENAVSDALALKVDKVAGKSLVLDTEITRLGTLANYNDATLVSSIAGKEPANANIQAHVISAHAPSDAQKNSDITKAEIEAKLTGELLSHTHASDATKQNTLVSGTNIKTINGASVLGSGDIAIVGGGGLNLRWFNVEDYGAVHNGSTDDTAAIQAAINACNAAGGGTVYFHKGIYIIGGALQTPSNAQITIPLNTHANSNTNTHIKLLGEVAPNFFSNPLSGGLPPNTGVVFKSTLTGAGKVFSSINIYTNYLGFNFCHLEFENITIRVKSKSGVTNIAPSATAIDAYNLAYLTCYNVRIDTESEHNSTVMPETTAKGIICPFTDNFVFVHLDKVLIYGYYIGVDIYECASLADVFIDCCYVGINFNSSNHSAYVSRSFISRCRTSIKASGTMSFFMNVGLEAHQTGTAWNKNVYDLEELAVGGQATIIYNRVEANVGRNNAVFNRATVSGTSLIVACSIGDVVLQGGASQPNSAVINTNVSITSNTITSEGYLQDDKVIKIENGTNAINYQVNGINASFIKGGTGSITFTQGLGRTLIGANGTLTLNGGVNSTASIVSIGLTDTLYINNL